MYHPDTLGAARWADPDDIARRFRYKSEHGFWLGRDPFNYDREIGFGQSLSDDRHIFLCSGTRGGKGRSIIINNLLSWEGSIVSVDPKGENASVCAARRSDGDEFCEGMGQDTYVLDPYNRARVSDKLRASCNLLDMLDPNSGSLLSEAASLADALRIQKDGGESESWSKDGADFTALVIAHVVTYVGIPAKDRNLVKVREYVCAGNSSDIDLIKKENMTRIKRARAEGKEPELMRVPDPFEFLLLDMNDNPAQRGAIKRRAKSYNALRLNNVRQWGSILKNSVDETGFIDDLQMDDSLSETGEYTRSFKIRDLKENPRGVSVFICLPDEPSHPAVRWQKALITLLLNQMQKDQEPPKNGKRVLMCLDEFAAMGKMERVADGMNSIAGAGVKLFISVTQIGDLERLYGKAWQKFLAGSGLHIWFQIDDLDTQEHIQKAFGDAEIMMTTQNKSHAKNQQTTDSESTAKSEGTSQGELHGTSKAHNLSTSVSTGENYGETQGRSATESKGQSSSWQVSDGRSHSRNRGRSDGQSDGTTHNNWMFFKPWVKSTNEGRNSQHSSGDQSGTSSNVSKGGGANYGSSITLNTAQTKGRNKSETHQEGHSETLSETYQTSRNEQFTETRGRSRSEGETWTEGTQQSFHKRPLITIPEMNRYLKRIDEREHPAYPGFALIRISGEEPFLVRKCYYDQDSRFEGHFTPHYAHSTNFLPFSKQRLLGCQYTPEHFLPIRLPEKVLAHGEPVNVLVSQMTDDWFDEGEDLLDWSHDAIGTCSVQAVADGKVIEIAQSEALLQDGDIIFLRLERAVDDTERAALEQAMFRMLLAYIDEQNRRERAGQEEIERQARLRKEEIARLDHLRLEEEKKQRRLKMEAEKRRQDIKRNIKMGIFGVFALFVIVNIYNFVTRPVFPDVIEKFNDVEPFSVTINSVFNESDNTFSYSSLSLHFKVDNWFSKDEFPDFDIWGINLKFNPESNSDNNSYVLYRIKQIIDNNEPLRCRAFSKGNNFRGRCLTKDGNDLAEILLQDNIVFVTNEGEASFLYANIAKNKIGWIQEKLNLDKAFEQKIDDLIEEQKEESNWEKRIPSSMGLSPLPNKIELNGYERFGGLFRGNTGISISYKINDTPYRISLVNTDTYKTIEYQIKKYGQYLGNIVYCNVFWINGQEFHLSGTKTYYGDCFFKIDGDETLYSLSRTFAASEDSVKWIEFDPFSKDLLNYQPIPQW